MRILHFADLHLGVENYNREIDPETGLSNCFGDFVATLDEVVEFAIESNIDLVLFCGDAYKSRDPSQTHQREFAKRVGRLASSGIPVFLLIGNHDLPNAIGRATTLEIFDTLAIRNIWVANRPTTYRIDTRQGPLQIVTLPWTRRSALLSREESKNLTLEQLNEQIQEIITLLLVKEVEKLDPGLPAILAAHASLFNAKPGSERVMTVGRDPLLLPSSLANPLFDYVALGHIHKYQILSYHPPLVYSGSLQRIDFSEEGDAKGFVVIQIDKSRKGETLFDFHPVKARRFLTIEVPISSHDTTPTNTILQTIARREQEIKGAIVRLHVTAPEHNEGMVQEPEIRKALKEAQHLTITKEVKREPRLRLGGWSVEGITPLEALKIYLGSKKTPPDQTRLLLEYGERLIKETEPKVS